MKKVFRKIFGIVGILSLLVGVLIPLTSRQAQAVTAWNVGDVFVGVGNGSYQVYDNNGVFKETINDGTGGFTTGCAFNNPLDKLYTANFSNANVVAYNDPSPHAIAQTIVTGDTSPESVVFAANGDFYVGHADGTQDVQRYNAAGVLQQSYNVAPEIPGRGSDWIDLAANQKTLFYTSEGRLVKRYDVVADAQLADFATLPGPRIPSIAFALRLLSPGDGTGGLLVADNDNIKRLDSAGAVVQTYDVVGEDSWFALNLDPNGTSFWSGNYSTGNFYRFNIASGVVELGPINTGAGTSLFGLCLKGEITAAQPEITLDPQTATNDVGTDHTVTATVTQGGNPVAGVLVTFSVAGANTGAAGVCTPLDCKTDANGEVKFTYTGANAGNDVITACFTGDNGEKHCTRAQKTWIEKIVEEGRMTGGGTIPAGSTTTLEGKHGFELHCDAADLPNRLEVNWGKGNKFHLENLTSAVCVDAPALDEEQPVAGFDTYRGKGTGRLNGVSGATAKWVFTDDGEPGTADHATISIFDVSNVLVATFNGNLKNGNHQAHP